MKKNRILFILMVLILCLGLLFGCGNNGKQSKEKYQIVCTIFPEYDWVRELIGQQKDTYELTLLMENGVDLHNYQPTVEDLALIAECDLFIYVGGESDQWVADALKQVGNEQMKTINLMEILGDAVKEEEIIEGMEHEEEHDHETDEHNEENEHETSGHDEEHEADEHVWLSVNNAIIITEEIKNQLCAIDSENREIYEETYEEYKKNLTSLNDEFTDMVEQAKHKTVLFGDRFPFRYLADDYGLDYYAAFSGCSAETESSFETITFLAGKVDELGLQSVCVIEGSDKKIAQTIVSNTKDKNQRIVIMDSMQSVTKKDREKGVTYLSIMRDNLKALEQALN